MRIKRILIISPQKDTLNSLKRTFEDGGFTPFIASGSGEALNLMKRERFSLGVLDLLSSEKETINFIRQAHHINPLSEFVVIAHYERLNERLIRMLKNQTSVLLLHPAKNDRLINSVRRAGELVEIKLKALLQPRVLEQTLKERTLQLLHEGNQTIIESTIRGVLQNILDPLTVIMGRAELVRCELHNIKQKGILQKKGQDLSSSIQLEMIQSLERIDQGIDKVCRNTQKIAQFMNGTLEESLKGIQSPQAGTDINALILEETGVLKNTSYSKNQVKKSYSLDFSLPLVDIMESSLSQVLANLISNAIDAMEESPIKELSINTSQNHETIFISIMDTGAGIPTHLSKKIFEPFFTTKNYEGNHGDRSDRDIRKGLGLYTSLELLKPYGGEIQVESTPGRGSLFKVLLPRSLAYLPGLMMDMKRDRVNKEEKAYQHVAANEYMHS